MSLRIGWRQNILSELPDDTQTILVKYAKAEDGSGTESYHNFPEPNPDSVQAISAFNNSMQDAFDALQASSAWQTFLADTKTAMEVRHGIKKV